MNPRELLAQCPLFARLTPEALDALAARAETLTLPGGRTLFEQGAVSDSIYIVATGRLVVILPDGAVAGTIGRLEPIGEIGALSGEPRNAAVHAIRDSLLLRIPGEHLYAVIRSHPDVLLEMTRVIIQRLRQNQHAKSLEAVRQARSFAVIPLTADADAGRVARGLAEALSSSCHPHFVTAESVDAALGPGAAQCAGEEGMADHRLLEYLNALEREHEHLIYLAGPHADAWARRCMRQVDRVLMVVDARSGAQASAMVDEWRHSGARAPVDLVVLRPEGVDAGPVLAWRDLVQARSHYFLRPGAPGDDRRLARSLTGRGVGLVLGGGGARGFAHVGLMRALAELDIPVDVVGGSSMGAFFSALVACGYDAYEMKQVAYDTFVAHNYLNDYIFPSIALIRGRRFVARLNDVFEGRQVEQLRLPFFCVSTNLTRGAAVVHDRGPLALWIATSMAVPGVAPPVVYRGELLADGAVINSLPTDVMQGLERGPIIASDVSTEGGIGAPGLEGPDPEGLFNYKGGSEAERPRLFSIIFRTATLTSESGVSARAARADCYLRMPVSRVGLFDWKRMDEVIDKGYQYAMEKLAPMRDKLLR